MWSRYQPSHWQPSDPSRSGALSQLQAFEDYWEDASVSLKCPDDWAMSQRAVWDCYSDLEVVHPCSPSYETVGGEESGCVEEMGRMQQCCTDGSAVSDEKFNSLTEEDAQTIEESEAEVSNFCSCFPPPIVTCATLSIKQGGRLVLKEVNARPHAFLRAQRENGRLRLQLIQPIDADEEDVEVDSEDELRDLTSEVSDDQIPLEESWRSCGIDIIETPLMQSEKAQDCRNSTSTGESACSIFFEEVEYGLCHNGSEREDAVVTSFDENGLVNRIVESIQIDNRLGFGVQVSRQQPPSPLWITGEANLKMWPASQLFLSQPLTRVTPVALCDRKLLVKLFRS